MTDWNGLMIAALARGGRLLENSQYTDAAKGAAEFILANMRKSDGRLYHRYRQGELAIKAQASDYAFFIFGLLELYQATFKPEYLREAITLQHLLLDDFWDNENGGYYTIAETAQDLPVRPKELYDGAIPSANSASLLMPSASSIQA